LHSLVYHPPRNGPILWEIGIPDRSAAEFYIPDPNPGFMNKLYSNHGPDKLPKTNYQQLMLTSMQAPFQFLKVFVL